MNKFVGIIPARYASSRFPGKPLAVLGDKTVIQHVVERVNTILDEVYVATDDERIFETVKGFGGSPIMTSTEHRTGTDRVMEAYKLSGSQADVIINIQGDEPFIAFDQIKQLMDCFNDSTTDIATLCRKFDKKAGFEALFDPNLVKVVFDDNDFALYFSRSIIPYVRGTVWNEWLDQTDFFTHVGIYAYRPDVLEKITKLPQSSLEKAESLEQLRWLQNGYRIKVGKTDTPTIGIDTPEDLAAAQKYLKELL